MADDIPNGVVIVLILVAIVVSVMGTWTVLDASRSVNNLPVGNVYYEAYDSVGSVSLEIKYPEDGIK
jgi:hypothetical protein